MSAIVIKSSTPAECTATSTESVLRLSEEKLVQAAKAGQSTAFATLSERYSQRLFWTAHRITRSREDAEDAVQGSLLLAFVHLRDFDGRSSFSTWLTRITINSALMILRKKRATPLIPFEEISEISKSAPPIELSDPGPSPEVSCLQRERKRILSMAMKELTPALRKVMELRDLRELSMQETARILGLSVSAVKGRLFHGRRQLRQMLQHGRPVVGGIQFRSSYFFNARKRRSVYEAA